MPDPNKPRKPRRWGLLGPYVVLALAAVAWSVFWLVLRSQLEDRLTREAANLRTSGWEAEWKALTIGGYPFRMEVELTDARVQEPYGWGLAAPKLQAVANAYDLDHWVFNAPDGLVLARPAAGKVIIAGEYLRASATNLGKAPRLAFEGEKVTFTPQKGAEPFAFTAAERVDLQVRATDPDAGQLYWKMTGAQPRRSGVFAQIAPLAPLSLTLQADLTRRAALAGRDWGSSVRAWTDAGGSASVHQLLVSVGDVSLSAQGGPLMVGGDGRLRGELEMSLRQGAAALAMIGAAQGFLDPAAPQTEAAPETHGAMPAPPPPPAGGELRLTFDNAVTRIGPIRIGPSPRVY